jgi:hypothetical protein
MRMAKLQKATLDPAKISGFCGRLKCCLRYEDETYTELKKRLPPRNTRVNTRLGTGRIVDYQVLAQLVMVELDNGTKTAIPRSEIEIIAPSQPGSAPNAPLAPLPTPPTPTPAENAESEAENDNFDDQTDTNEPETRDSDQ